MTRNNRKAPYSSVKTVKPPRYANSVVIVDRSMQYGNITGNLEETLEFADTLSLRKSELA